MAQKVVAWQVDPVFDDESEMPTGDFFVNSGAPIDETKAYAIARLFAYAPELVELLRLAYRSQSLESLNERIANTLCALEGYQWKS